MEIPGIMLYGYKKSDAEAIKRAIETILNNEVILLSGSKKETQIINDILADEISDIFENKEVKMLMFLGFDDKQIDMTLKGFPGPDNVKRPVFCGLTENNISWTLETLLEHLLEEQKYWSNKK